MSKYNRTNHLPYSPGSMMIEYLIVSTLGYRNSYYEKLDGENTGMKDEGVYARSHAEFTTSGWSREVRQLHKVKVGQLGEGLFLFGENMEGIHSIEYNNLDSYFYILTKG
jgi:hypothetical protein